MPSRFPDGLNRLATASHACTAVRLLLLRWMANPALIDGCWRVLIRSSLVSFASPSSSPHSRLRLSRIARCFFRRFPPRLAFVCGAMSEQIRIKEGQMTNLADKIHALLAGHLNRSDKSSFVHAASIAVACQRCVLSGAASVCCFIIAQDLAEIDSRLREFQTALDGANLELKELGAHAQKSEFTKQLRDRKQQLKDLRTDYESNKASSSRGALLSGAAASASAASSSDAEMRRGLGVQAAGIQSLRNTLAHPGSEGHWCQHGSKTRCADAANWRHSP